MNCVLYCCDCVFCCDEVKLPQWNLQYSACHNFITRFFFQQVEYCLFMSGMAIFRLSCFQCGFRRYSCAFGRKKGEITFRYNIWGLDTSPLKVIYSWSGRQVLMHLFTYPDGKTCDKINFTSKLITWQRHIAM